MQTYLGDEPARFETSTIQLLDRVYTWNMLYITYYFIDTFFTRAKPVTTQLQAPDIH